MVCGLFATIYLHIGRLFLIYIFDHSAAFNCRNILDAEKGMLEVYQKRTFIEIDTNLRTFSAGAAGRRVTVLVLTGAWISSTELRTLLYLLTYQVIKAWKRHSKKTRIRDIETKIIKVNGTKFSKSNKPLIKHWLLSIR